MDDGWLENLDDLSPDTPPDLIDEGIARLTACAENAGAGMLFLRASLMLIRHVQSTFVPGRVSAPDDLDRTVRDGTEALVWLHRVDAADFEFESAVLQVLTEALQLRDAPGDLDRAIDLMTEATRRFPAGSSPWATTITGLGDRYLARYTTYHRATDFVAAERAIRTAIDSGLSNRPPLWLRLGSLYEERFRVEANLRDHRRALEILYAGWAEGWDYPPLALSYADAVVNSGAVPTAAELDTAIEGLAAIGAATLPAMLEPQFRQLVMATHFRRFNESHHPADLHATVAAADHLVTHPDTEPQLRAEARWIRATVRLDHASHTGARMADIDPIIGDLAAAVTALKPDQRRFADTQLIRVLAERARRTGHDRDFAAAEAYAGPALQRLPEGTAEHAEVQYHLAFLLGSRAEAGRADLTTVDRAIGLFREVVEDTATAPKVRAAAAGQLAIATAGRVYYHGGDPSAVDTAITWASDALRVTSLDDLNRVALAASVAGALLVRYEMRGDLADLRWCLDLLQDTRNEVPDDPNRRELMLTLAQAQIMWSQAAGEAPAAETLAILTDVLTAAAPGDPRRIQALRSLAGGYAMRAEQTDDADDWRRAVRYAREMLAGLPAVAPFTALMRMSAGGTLILAGQAHDDVELLRDGTDLIAAALLEPAGQLLRGRYLAAHGMALLELHRRAPRAGDLDRAVSALREADDFAAAEPGQRGAAEIGLALASALALAGDPVAAAETGRAALRARAWQVLQQSGTHEAMTAAGRTATDALQVARTALSAGDRSGAWLALETGRGLVLHAATVAATVPDLLRASGEPELAERWSADALTADGARWRSAAPAIPSDARSRALAVLAREVNLFDPPSIGAVGAALTAVDADALVYLFPGMGGEPGLALIVERGGRVDTLDLPGLTGDWAVPAIVQQATRDLQLAPVDSTAGRTLTGVCRAAWDVAIRPLLDHWRQTNHPAEPHLVLVPGGPLATVPWHAAHGPDRWAIDEAAFSYIASGRLLVDVARRPAPPRSGVALVIGNPNTGRPGEALPNAGIEASTIFRRYYAAGRYCGRPEDPTVAASGPGLPEDVFEWLTAAGTSPAAVLHLACHGVVRADGPASSYLLLAGGARVSAEQILRAARGRPAGRSPGLVSLAACTTHRAGRAYDEAVTLSTAFLVAGATTAIGSLWPVPDQETAQLMVAFHDNLAVGRMPPRVALRQAQRAMRDATDEQSLSHWAGFVHLGQ